MCDEKQAHGGSESAQFEDVYCARAKMVNRIKAKSETDRGENEG
jgi:hypothetical protein